MSIVVVKVDENKIEFASDSITIKGDTQEKAKDHYAKLMSINSMIIGSVGECRESSMLQMFCKTRKPKGVEELDILEFFCEFLEWKKKKTDKYESNNDHLFGFMGKVFYWNNFFVKEITSYEAIGAGRTYALAALYLDHSTDKAVEVACELSVWCEKPIQCLTMLKGHSI